MYKNNEITIYIRQYQLQDWQILTLICCFQSSASSSVRLKNTNPQEVTEIYIVKRVLTFYEVRSRSCWTKCLLHLSCFGQVSSLQRPPESNCDHTHTPLLFVMFITVHSTCVALTYFNVQVTCLNRKTVYCRKLSNGILKQLTTFTKQKQTRI